MFACFHGGLLNKMIESRPSGPEDRDTMTSSTRKKASADSHGETQRSNKKMLNHHRLGTSSEKRGTDIVPVISDGNSDGNKSDTKQGRSHGPSWGQIHNIPHDCPMVLPTIFKASDIRISMYIIHCIVITALAPLLRQ